MIIAGKAHLHDAAGQATIKEWNEFLRRAEVRGHAVFLSDYDMLVTQKLIAGVGIWINTLRRPWEACGTRVYRKLLLFARFGVLHLRRIALAAAVRDGKYFSSVQMH